MRLGLISDIHASYASLVRAFDILADHRAERVVCMGDIVQKGTDGEAVVRLLREHWVLCVQGNHDANAVRRAREEGDLGSLSTESVDWLAALPAERTYRWDGVRVAVAHAAPGGLDAYVWPEIPKEVKRAMRTLEQDVVLLGHTHLPMRVRYREILLVNPGSVTGGRTRDSHTCGLLSLPSCELEVFSLDDGRRVDVATA
jgi:putative phosphoesterase